MNNYQEALRQAVSEWEQAELAFLQADPEYCDYYVYRLHAAEEKVGLIVRQAKAALGYPLHGQLPVPYLWANALAAADQMGDVGDP